MSMKLSLSVLTLIVLGSLNPLRPAQAQSISFICNGDSSNTPTTYAQTPDGNIPVFKWTSNFFRPPYTPARRCSEVSDRMNRFYSAGRLDYLTSGVVNRQPVICAGQSCSQDNVLITLKPGQNPNQVLQEIENNRSGAGGPSFQLSPSTSSPATPSRALSRNANGTMTLNLKEYLQNSTPEAVQPTQPENRPSGIFNPQNPPTDSPQVPRW